ncbi:MAG: O-antigen ligase family protein [Candidatus Fermentibacteria bacterium]
MLRALLVTLLIAAAIGIMQYVSISTFSRIDMSLGYIYRGRIASLFGNPNIFAGYLELGIPLAVAMIFTDKERKWKITAAIAVILGIFAVLYTFSRGGLLGVFLGCGITLMYIFRSRILIPILVGVAVVIILIMSVGTFERQMTFFMDPSAHLTQPTILHRYITYRGFINQFSGSPVTGVGWGAREFYWGRSLIYSFWEVRHCVSREMIKTFGGLNSLFLNHAVKGGVVSLGSVLLVFTTIYMVFIRALRRGGGILAVAMFAGIFSFMIHQIIGNQLRFPTVNSQFWFVTGLLLVLASSDLIKQGREEILNPRLLPESTKQEDSEQKGENVSYP